jgi:hypothetical protein
MLEDYFINKTIRTAMTQGNQHRKVTDLYKLIVSAARTEYTEDNKPTLDAFLVDCHARALKVKSDA